MKFPRTKKSDESTQDGTESPVSDAESLLTHRTHLPEKETIPGASESTAADKDTDDYDFLTELFDHQKPAVVVSKKPVKKTTVTDLLKGKPKKTAAEKQPPKNKVLRLCLMLGIILAVLVAVFAGIITVTQVDEDTSDGFSNIFDTIASFFNPDVQDAAEIQSVTPAVTLLQTPKPTPVPTATPEIRNPAVSDLTIPEGDYFYAGKQTSDIVGGIYASEQDWKTVQTAGISSGAWVVSEFRITVNPAKVPVYYQNKQYTTIVIEEPWRISWKVSGTGTDPYTGAELILNQYDEAGNVIKTYGFGWKGKYSADTEQITAEFQPGEYELGVFLRGTGITLDFQQLSKEMPFYNNLTVRGK